MTRLSALDNLLSAEKQTTTKSVTCNEAFLSNIEDKDEPIVTTFISSFIQVWYEHPYAVVDIHIGCDAESFPLAPWMDFSEIRINDSFDISDRFIQALNRLYVQKT